MIIGVKRKFSEVAPSGATTTAMLEARSSDRAVGFRNEAPYGLTLYFSPIPFHSESDDNRASLNNCRCEQSSPKGVVRMSDGVLGISNSEEPGQRADASLCSSSLFYSAGSDSDSEEELSQLFKKMTS